MSEPAVTVSDLYRRAAGALSAAPRLVGAPRFEAGVLCDLLTGTRRGRAHAGNGSPAPAGAADRLEAMLRERLMGRPLQYIAGRWEFYGLEFAVGEGVLIPRPETELLVERAIGALAGNPCPAVFDLCAGSGCIAVAVAKHLPGARVYAVEKSPEALAFLRQNVRAHGVCNVAVVEGDVLHPAGLPLPERAHLIVGNPPYLTAGEMRDLDPTVAREPAMALDGGGDGLLFYRAIAAQFAPRLDPGGRVMLECSAATAPGAAAALKAEGLCDVEIVPDLAGIPRVVTAKKR